VGTLALIRAPVDGDVRYLECHVNFWSLAGLMLRRIYLLDIGLAFTPAGNQPVKKLGLLLPFRADQSSFTDLYELLTANQETAALVFGTRVDVSKDKFVIHEPAGDKEWVPVVARGVSDPRSDAKGWRKENLSVWWLELDQAIRIGQTAYVRVRFTVSNPARTWIWGRAKRSALIDLRFGEVRETVTSGNEAKAEIERLSRDFVGVEKLNVLVIAPSWLQPRAWTPQLRYMRLFEGRVWEPYLDRAVDLGRTDNLMIYHWRHTAADDPQATPVPDAVTPAHPRTGRRRRPAPNPEIQPFRAFLLLSKETRLAPVGNHLLTAVLAGAAVLAVINWSQSVDAATRLWSSYWGWLAAAVSISAASILLRLIGPFRSFLSHLPRAFRGFEKSVFRARSKLAR
jgi:hypothetical protein